MTMLKETMERKPKHGRVLFYLIIAVFIISALYFVPQNSSIDYTHDVTSDINNLYLGIQSIFYGDIDGFFDGFVGGLPVLALFLVLFSIFHFLFAHVLKSMFGRKGVATTLALVVSAYGFIDHRVYNYLLSLNAFAIGLLVFFALLIMIWGFSDHSIRRVDEEFKGLKQNHKDTKALREQMKADEEEIRRLKKLMRES
jgi:signal transduction histidine kinase